MSFVRAGDIDDYVFLFEFKHKKVIMHNIFLFQGPAIISKGGTTCGDSWRVLRGCRHNASRPRQTVTKLRCRRAGSGEPREPCKHHQCNYLTLSCDSEFDAYIYSVIYS